ncbi:AraC family transcriptional regulator [Microbulbifer hydrolyticus]|uniref:AraC-like DNA-binding protein n=1 Tax=Microbulbifer hydrolyticus TaxID=48074 RepID=A0A6P1TFX0_9GAMM|nr:AraC family transcriptional regulator [Microbulbifer hydrolyticus]MBB5212526.1 AraC-like DNA-binding protein [Microbulbifer hydrolyticus]QHQ40149.1 helix-turn-helix domain-containing protein [Microbulbifer hydrolyticus]
MDFDARLIPLHRHPLGFIEVFSELGAPLTALLKGTGISPTMFEMQEARISYHQWQALLSNGVRLCQHPQLGLITGLKFHWSFWGPLGRMVDCSPSLKDIAESFRRYMVAVQPFYALHAARSNSYLDKGNRVVEPINYATSQDADPVLRDFVRQFRLATTLRLWDECGNKSVADPDIHVRLDFPQPSSYEFYQKLPCQSLQFGCEESSISGSIELVFKKFRPLRLRTYERLQRECEQELDQFSGNFSFAERVRWHMRSNFTPTLELNQVAEQLQIAPRALSRRLATDGETFRSLLHEIRMEIALHHLRHSCLAVEEIADYTGFSCASSLRRAVKNWSGKTANELRTG